MVNIIGNPCKIIVSFYICTLIKNKWILPLYTTIISLIGASP